MATPSEVTPLTARKGLQHSYNDAVDDMTWGRRLSRHLSQYEWYNPPRNAGETAPSLDAAWAYFEHVTLGRYIVGNQDDTHRVKAEPGEEESPTKLYSVFGTAEHDLADFGVGVGVYFYTLRILSGIMLVAALINTPNLVFFMSERYNGLNLGLKFLSLQASAVCTDESWAACPTCTKEDWDKFPSTYDRYAEAKSSDDGSVLSFIKIYNCDISNGAGLIAYVSLTFVCAAIYILQKMTKFEEVRIDNANITTSDFSVEVTNPPKDARSPDEWKAFFEQFGHVSSVTVTLDNEELLVAMLNRRRLVMAMEDLQPAGVVVDSKKIDAAAETALPLTSLQKLMQLSNATTLKRKIKALDEKIECDLSKRMYEVSEVFVIFEKPSSKNAALKQLNIGGIHVLLNDKSILPDNLLFRGEHILYVVEPPEPSSVRWRDLDETFLVQVCQRCVTSLLTLGVIIVACLGVVRVRNHYGIAYAAIAISVTNSIIPEICYKLTDLESHPSEGSKQASNYFKITACLWVITTILTAFVTPFTDTLSSKPESLMPAVYTIFITELIFTPITKVLDISGHFYRHILAPRAPDQRRMNVYFTGALYYLSERYTNMTNVIFITFYYAMIYPAGFVWAAATLVTHYWVDKFCLLRNWAPAPALGSKIAELSRLYFFSSALVAYALMSSYNYASFPYDNACKLDESVSDVYVGSFTGQTAEGVPIEFSISHGDQVYKYCNQDMLRYKPWPAFPATSKAEPAGEEWMDPGQEFSFIYGWTACGIITFVGLIFANAMRKRLQRFFLGRTLRHEKPIGKGFSGSDLYGYIPQFKLQGSNYPTLLCDLTEIGEDLINWEDPTDKSKRSHNAIYDHSSLSPENMSVSSLAGVLTVVRQWTVEI